MADSHVVTGLVDKRREVAGVIDHHRQEMLRMADAQAHLDAAIKLFAPELDLRAVRAKEHRARNPFFLSGQAPRFILDTLWEASAPLTCRKIAERALAAEELDATAELLDALQKSRNGALKTPAGKGILAEGPRAGVARTWRIAYFTENLRIMPVRLATRCRIPTSLCPSVAAPPWARHVSGLISLNE